MSAREHTIPAFLIALSALCTGGGPVTSWVLGEEQPLSVAEFERLHEELQLPEDEAWRLLPWQTSILEARVLAAKHRKPLYMLVRSGHPLGCV